MPELPEVEVLIRHLEPRLRGRIVESVDVRREASLEGISARALTGWLRGGCVEAVSRRGKYGVFGVRDRRGGSRTLLIHLGMTGRLYLQTATQRMRPAANVLVLGLGAEECVFEDVRRFGRVLGDERALDRLGPEPLSERFTSVGLRAAFRGSRQAVKVKLMDQSVVAGIGNIYASESLYRAGISPRRMAGRLRPAEVDRLHDAIVTTLKEAIQLGLSLSLDWSGESRRGGERGGTGEGLFYFGSGGSSEDPRLEASLERFRVYGRGGEPCLACGTPIRRIVQVNRSTFYCPACQKVGSVRESR